LEENEWVVKDAMTAYKADLEWEKSVDSKAATPSKLSTTVAKTKKPSAALPSIAPVVSSIPVAVAVPVPIATARPIMPSTRRHKQNHHRAHNDEMDGTELQPLYPSIHKPDTNTTTIDEIIASAPSLDELAPIDVPIIDNVVAAANIVEPTSSSSSIGSVNSKLKSSVYPSLLLAA
jgi:hypothetical protein